MTALPKIVSDSISLLLDHRKGNGMEFDEADAVQNRSGRVYLFHPDGQPTRCLSESQWTKKVKLCFKAHSPRKVSCPPMLLRSSFITALRGSGEACPEVLQSAAHCMKHAVATQGSDVYDLDTHVKLTEAAFKWCEKYATKWSQAQEEAGYIAEHDQHDAGMEVDVSGPDDGHVDSPEQAQPPQQATTSKRSVREVIPQTVAKAKKAKGATQGETTDTNWVIEGILGAAPTKDGVRYNILWEGSPECLDWWQSLELNVASKTLADESMLNKTISLEDGVENKLALLRSYDSAAEIHTIVFGNGFVAQISLSECKLKGDCSGAVAWALVSPVAQGPVCTDQDVDWAQDDSLRVTRDSWDGSTFPDFIDAKCVVLQVQEQQVFAIETARQVVDDLARLCTWLHLPKSGELVMMQQLCQSLAACWLDGALVRHSFLTLASLDSKSIRALKTSNNTVAGLVAAARGN